MTPRRELWLPVLLAAAIALIALRVVSEESPPRPSAPSVDAPVEVTDGGEPSAVEPPSPALPESPAAGAPGEPGALPDVGSGILVGTVTGDAGDPISGARIEIVARSGSVHSAVAESDAEGRYRVEEVPPGSYRMYASADRFIPLGWRGPEIVVEIAEGETQVRDVMIPRGEEYRGRVLAGDTPIPGVTIRVMVADAADPAEPPLYEERFTSDDDGRFRAEGIPAGAIELTVGGDWLEPVLVRADRVADLPSEISLRDAILLEAEIVTSDDSAPPGLMHCRVVFQPDVPSLRPELPDGRHTWRFTPDEALERPSFLLRDGSAPIGLFSPGLVRLEVSAAGFLDPPPVEVRLGARAIEWIAIELVPEPTFECDVRVFDRRGRPVSGAAIRVFEGGRGSGRTDERGLARVAGKGTPQLIEVMARGYAHHRSEPSPAGFERRLDIELRDEAIVEVRALRADGSPFAGACLLFPIDTRGPASIDPAGGSLRFPGLAAGSYEVRVFDEVDGKTRKEWVVVRTIAVEEGREMFVDITLP